MSFFFLGFIKYRVPVCRALCDSMRSVVSNTERRRQSCCTTVTTVLCSRHRVPHPEVLESLSSAPACGVGSERVWVDLASSWPVCQPQLQQCATVSTQTPLCLSSSSSSSSYELNPSTAGADGMEAQSVVFFSPFSMFTVVFHLQPECQLNNFFSLEKKPPSSFCSSCPSSELVDFEPDPEVLLPPPAEGSTPVTVP